MAEFTLQEIIDATSGTCKGDVSLQFKDISTDTRTIEAGYVFVALRGDTFDGHDFINTAIEKGQQQQSLKGTQCRRYYLC